jgi:predicted RNA binding protein YcfA (HicA-like mRNA interferase family)
LTRVLRGVRGEEAIKAFLRAGGVKRGGKGDHINIKMPNGKIITIPGRGELKAGLLIATVKKAGLTPGEFTELLKGGD